MLCVMGEDKEAQQQVALKTQREPLMVRVCWGKGYLLPKIYIYTLMPSRCTMHIHGTGVLFL
jgi:hypothetical protein